VGLGHVGGKAALVSLLGHGARHVGRHLARRLEGPGRGCSDARRLASGVGRRWGWRARAARRRSRPAVSPPAAGRCDGPSQGKTRPGASPIKTWAPCAAPLPRFATPPPQHQRKERHGPPQQHQHPSMSAAPAQPPTAVGSDRGVAKP
jgi:hypothetical protein